MLLAAAVLRLVFVFLATPDEKDRDALFVGFNDERAHHNYVRYLAAHGRLSVQTVRITDPGAFERYEFEYYQPPLYYVLAVPFQLAGEALCQGCGLYAVRLFSLALSLALLALMYRFLRRSVAVPGAAEGITLFLALLLGQARFAAQVNNDNLLWLLALALFVVLFDDLERGGGRPRNWVVLGVLAGAGLLTKSSMLTVMAGPPVALLARRRDGRAWRSIGLYAGIALLVALPWWIRNRLVYGEWLATSVAVGEPRSDLGLGFLRELFGLHLQRAAFQFWSAFENTYPRPLQQWTIKLLAFAMLAILIVAARHWILRARRERAAWTRERPYFCGLLAAAAGNLAGLVWYAYRYGQGEIRMLFPCLACLAYLALAPLYATVPRRQRAKLTWVLAVCAALPWLGFIPT